MKPTPLALAIGLLSTFIGASQAPPPSAQIPDVALGAGFTLVVKADGTVVGCGRNTDSQSAQPAAFGRSLNRPRAKRR